MGEEWENEEIGNYSDLNKGMTLAFIRCTNSFHFSIYC